MAQIPDFTALGPRPTPTPSYRRVQVDDSGAGVFQAAAGFGQAMERADENQRNQDQQLTEAKAQNAVEQHDLALKTTAESMRENILTGQVPYAQARDQFDQQVQNIPQPDFEGVRKSVTSILQGRIQRNIASSQFGIDGVVNAAKRDDFKAQFGQGLDTLGKLAGMPDADIDDINARAQVYRPLARNAGIPEATIDKALQDFKDKNWLNQATQRSMEAKDSMPDLHELQHDLTDADGFYAGKLDTDKRNMVLRTVLSDQSILQNRMDHEADKREAKAQRAIGQIDEQISSGVPLSSDMWDTAQRVTQGTSFADDFKQRLKDEEQVQQVLHQPIDQQQAYVQQRQQQLDTEGGSMKDRANLNRLQTAVNQNINLMQKAPLLFGANRNGTEVAPLDFNALNPQADVAHAVMGDQAGPNPKQQFSAQIADRMNTLTALRKQYGPTITPSVLLPQEATALAGQLDNATPPQRAQILTALRGTMNNDDAYQAAMHQIAPHSPVTAIAGQMVGNSAPASTPAWFDSRYAPKVEDVARILSGDSLLNPSKATTGQQEKGELKSTVPMPLDGTNNSPGLRDAFMRRAGDLFRGRPELGETYFAAFKAADAGLRAEKGDLKGDPNTTIEQQALAIALGPPGSVFNFNGARVKVPDGMDPTQFKGYVNNAVAAAAKAAGGGADWADRIQGYRLHEGYIGDPSSGSVGSGRYTVMDGAIPMARPDGKGPLTIDLRKQYAPSVNQP